MTTAMRAIERPVGLSSQGKLLRIGVVRAGRIVEERIIKQRVSVTVGTRETSMFVLTARDAPAAIAELALFERMGNDYYLALVDGMDARIALTTGVHDIDGLRGMIRPDHPHRVRLTEDARGRIVLGETTFLFQFVAPPPPQAMARLPLSVKNGLFGAIDWDLTILAAFSFLLHFGIIGALCSDWMDPVVDEAVAVRLVDPVSSLPGVSTEMPVEPATSHDTVRSAPAPSSAGQVGAGKVRATDPGARAGEANERAIAAIAEEANAMKMGLLATFERGAAVQRAMDRGDVPLSNLDEVAKSPAGVVGDEMHLGSGQIVRPRAAGGGLASIGNGRTDGAGEHGGREAPAKGPLVGDAYIEPPSMSVHMADAERVVATLRPKFRLCYQRGLNSDPEMAGAVTIVAKVAPNGEVREADPSHASGLSPYVVACIQRVVRNAQFAAVQGTAGTGGTIQIPVKFVRQAR